MRAGKFDVLEIAGLIEGTQADFSSCQAAVDRLKRRYGFAIDGDVYRSGVAVVNETYVIPMINCGEGGRAYLGADSDALAAEDVEDAVVNRLLQAGVGGEVSVIEVRRIAIGEYEDKRPL